MKQKATVDYIVIVGVFTSTGVTGYKGIRVTFCNVFKWRKVTLIPLYPVTPVLVNTPSESVPMLEVACFLCREETTCF